MPPKIMNLDEMIQKLQNEIKATDCDIENTRLNLIYLQDKLGNILNKKNALIKLREEMKNCVSLFGRCAVIKILEFSLNQNLESELAAAQFEIRENNRQPGDHDE